MRSKIIIFLSIVLMISCSKPEPRKPIVRKTSSFMTESVERNKALNKIEEESLKLKMDKDTLHEYISSEHGFWYFYNKKNTSDGDLPVIGDEVIFSYEIKDLNGTVLYSKEELGEKHYLIDREELITGLQEGIKLMKKDEVISFLFPFYKAFGYTGNERIKPNQSLIYTVHLKEINHKN